MAANAKYAMAKGGISAGVRARALVNARPSLGLPQAELLLLICP